MKWIGFIDYIEDNRLTSAEIAKKLEVSKGTVDKWRQEKGSCSMIKFSMEYFPKLKELAQIKKPTFDSILIWGDEDKNKTT